jgi:Transposase IS116/IS110/IS902 family
VATGEIDALAKHDDRVDVLCQLRGIGRCTAMLVIAEVGDVSRFGSARKLCAWAGLTPTIRSSDGKARSVTSQSRDRGRCAGRSSRQPKTPPAAAARSATASNESPNAGGARSPRSRSRARSSRSATTACAMERSVAWRAAADRARQYSWRPRRESRRPPDRRRRRRTRCGCSGELAVCHGLHPQWTAAHLIEPPSSARHPGPRSATGWMTGPFPLRRPP